MILVKSVVVLMLKVKTVCMCVAAFLNQNSETKICGHKILFIKVS